MGYYGNSVGNNIEEQVYCV